MAHFRGTVQGSRGEASRLGGKGSGIEAVVASWNVRVRTIMYDKDGVDCVRIYFEDIKTGERRDIHDGPIVIGLKTKRNKKI